MMSSVMMQSGLEGIEQSEVPCRSGALQICESVAEVPA